MHPIAKVLDLGVFFVLLFAFDWGFLPALIASVLVGFAADRVIRQML